MLWRMLRQSWGRNLRRKVLAIITVFLASSLISALLAVSIDIGDKMSRELKSYGANILIEPAGQAALPALFSESSNPLSGQDFLDEAELPNIKDIFWRNNIVGFAPMLGGEASVEGEPVRILGTFFSQPVDIPDEEGYETGQKTVSPYWQVTGDWPQEPAGAEPQTLVGHALARQMGWKPGDKLTLRTEGEAVQVTVSGILSSGGDEDNQLVMPLSTVQHLLGLPGKVQAIRVSALTVPENELSRRAREIPGRAQCRRVRPLVLHGLCVVDRASAGRGDFRCGSAPGMAGRGVRRGGDR